MPHYFTLCWVPIGLIVLFDSPKCRQEAANEVEQKLVFTKTKEVNVVEEERERTPHSQDERKCGKTKKIIIQKFSNISILNRHSAVGVIRREMAYKAHTLQINCRYNSHQQGVWKKSGSTMPPGESAQQDSKNTTELYYKKENTGP